MTPVHMAITHNVKQGNEQSFVDKLQTFASQSMAEPGMTGIHILRPPSDSSSRQFGILRSFNTQHDADRFYESEMFADWQLQIATLIDGPPRRRKLSGLEAFFRLEQMPPRWKMAIVTFIGVLPTVLLWSTLLPPLLASLHWLAVAAIVNAAVVATLTWLAMPFLTQLLHNWLHR